MGGHGSDLAENYHGADTAAQDKWKEAGCSGHALQEASAGLVDGVGVGGEGQTELGCLLRRWAAF